MEIHLNYCRYVTVQPPLFDRHSREGGNPVTQAWIPAFAGMTAKPKRGSEQLPSNHPGKKRVRPFGGKFVQTTHHGLIIG